MVFYAHNLFVNLSQSLHVSHHSCVIYLHNIDQALVNYICTFLNVNNLDIPTNVLGLKWNYNSFSNDKYIDAVQNWSSTLTKVKFELLKVVNLLFTCPWYKILVSSLDSGLACGHWTGRGIMCLLGFVQISNGGCGGRGGDGRVFCSMRDKYMHIALTIVLVISDQ